MASDVSLTPSGEINRHETRRLIASDKVEGTVVYSIDKERLGKIHNFMVDKISGRVDYAVMSFGGILGLGEAYHPIPWEKLEYDTALNGYVIDIDKNQLQGAPSYTDDSNPNWVDPSFGQRIDDYYGATTVF